MQWLKGDVHSAFADLPDLRIRAAEYEKLVHQRDSLLALVEKNAVSNAHDSIVFEKFKARCMPCSSQLIWGIREHAFRDEAGNWMPDGRLVWGNFCQDNFCPICARKKSVRLSRQLNELMEKLYDEGYVFYHMVLSDRSCELKDIALELDRYNKAFRTFADAHIKHNYDGYYLSLEYTLKNENGKCMIHPHFHIILAASKERFSAGETFMEWDKLRRIWARSLKIPFKELPPDSPPVLKRDREFEYLPFVSIYKVREGDGKIFAELTKYITDYNDLMVFMVENPGLVHFGELYGSFVRRQVNRGSGVLNLSHKNLHFVQLQNVQTPEYVPEFFSISQLNKDRVMYSQHYVVKADDFVRLDDEAVAPIKCFIKTYVKHQAYYYGYNFSKGSNIHLPEWWEDVSVDPTSLTSPPQPKARLPVYEQLSFFDSV